MGRHHKEHATPAEEKLREGVTEKITRAVRTQCKKGRRDIEERVRKFQKERREKIGAKA